MSGLVNVSHGLNEWRFACLGFVRIFVKSTIKYLRLLFFFFGWCVFSESSKHQKRCGKIDIRMNNCTLHRLFIFYKFYHVNIFFTSSYYHHIVNIVFIHYNRCIVYWSKQSNLFSFSGLNTFYFKNSFCHFFSNTFFAHV